MEKGTKVIALIDKGYELYNRVYDKKKSAPTIRTFQGGGLQPKVIKRETQIKNNSGTER